MLTTNDLAAKADAYYGKREARLTLQKTVNALEEEEKALKAELLEALTASTTSGVSGVRCYVQAVMKQKPDVLDSEAFREHVRSTGEFDLMIVRTNEKAIKERWDAGKEVPGVGSVTVMDLSIHKLK